MAIRRPASVRLFASKVGSAPAASAAARSGNDKSTLLPVRNSIGSARGSSGFVGDQIDHADGGMIGECLERQQEFIRAGQACEKSAVACLHHLGRFGKDRCRGDDGRALVERLCQSRIALIAAAIEQQQIERDHAGFKAGDRVDQGGEIAAR